MMKDPLNKVIMEDIGLTVDSNNRVMDQDTREYLSYRDKNMKFSSQNSVTLTNQDIIFDPITDKAVMGSLFNHYLGKIEEEDGVYVALHYEQRSEDGKSTALVAKVDNQEITTDYYKNDSLKYVEMIKRLNGDSDYNMKDYDKSYKKDNSVISNKKRKADFR